MVISWLKWSGHTPFSNNSFHDLSLKSQFWILNTFIFVIFFAIIQSHYISILYASVSIIGEISIFHSFTTILHKFAWLHLPYLVTHYGLNQHFFEFWMVKTIILMVTTIILMVKTIIFPAFLDGQTPFLAWRVLGDRTPTVMASLRRSLSGDVYTFLSGGCYMWYMGYMMWVD